MRVDFMAVETIDGEIVPSVYINGQDEFGAALVAAQADPKTLRTIVAKRAPVRVKQYASPSPAATTSRRKTSTSRSKS